NRQIEEIRQSYEQKIQSKKEELDEFKKKIEQVRIEMRGEYADREHELNVQYQRKLDEKETRWQDIYSSREEELIQAKKKLADDLEELRRENLRVERQWNVRLEDKEEKLKDLQIEKAQRESKYSEKLNKASEELTRLRTVNVRLDKDLREKEEAGRELRARMAQRDVQWKTAYKNKQAEVKKLLYQLEESRKGVLFRFFQSLTGSKKKREEQVKKEIKKIKESSIV
ncbi:MAG: hypothetical protein U9R36_05915, partial [Elusimicrobiota bacterium]|nr:hypothetical protein [Elusimicrobiota bacterium]